MCRVFGCEPRVPQWHLAGTSSLFAEVHLLVGHWTWSLAPLEVTGDGVAPALSWYWLALRKCLLNE